jgi:outer membrane protein TolC
MKRSILCAITLLMLAPSLAQEAQAQSGDTCLSLSQAMDLSAANDPGVATNQARKREAIAGADEARSLFKPQISAFARTGLGDVGLIDSAIQNQIGLSASQRLFDFGDARLAREAARFNVAATEQDINLSRQQAALRAASAILEMSQAQEAIVLTNDREAFFRQQLEAVKAALAEGGATISERAEVAAQVANAQAFFLDLQEQRDNAQTILNIETGTANLPCERPLIEAEFSTMATSLESVDALLASTLRDAPELQGLEARAKSLSAQSERQRRERLPIVSVVGSAAYSSIGSAGNFELQERIGLDVAIPLYAGNAIRARGRGATAREAAAKGEVAQRRRELEQDVRTTYRRVLSLRAQEIAAQDFEDRSQELLEFAEIEYAAGTRTLPDLIDVRIEYEEAALRRIGIKFARYNQMLQLLSLSGQL